MRRAVCLLACVLMALCAGARAEHEGIAAALKRYDTTGAQVAFAKDGELLTVMQYGRAVGGGKEPVTENTVFRLASVTKMVSAVGLMQLVERGVFDLDADISEYLGFTVRNPRFPDAPVTLRQILTHTSGLQEPFAYTRAKRGETVYLRDVLAGDYAQKAFGKKAPGAEYDYSNLGGALIGVFIEIGSGMPADAYMTQNVFAPLGIEAHYHRDLFPEGTLFATITETLPSYAAARPEELVVNTAGNLWMNAEGLAKIAVCLCGDGSYGGVSILAPETAREMRQNQSGRGSVACEVDYGLSVQTLHGTPVKGREMGGHQGTWERMLCGAFFDESDQTVCVALTNRSREMTRAFIIYPVLRDAVRAAYDEFVK